MKLFQILSEDAAEYIVYKVTSPHTDMAYYGYATGQSVEDIKRGFLTGSQRTDALERGDGKMLQAAKEDIDTLKFDMIDVFSDEVEAFTSRNDNRAQDAKSITGPTQFPGNVYKRALAAHPERAKLWKVQQSMATMHVRDAMKEPATGLTYQMIKDFAVANPQARAEMQADMDKLVLPQFMAKYFPGPATPR